jgi:UDP-N-acetylmuramate dehydrogenase
MQIHEDFLISEKLWYRIGGRVKYFLQASTVDDVLRALDFVEKKQVKKLFICGLGSNLLFTDDYFNGAVIQIVNSSKSNIAPSGQKEQQVDAFAGEILDNLIQASFKENLIGLEWAFGGEIKDSLLEAQILDIQKDGFDIKKIHRDNFHFSYRNSLVKENSNLIILSGVFLLKHASSNELQHAKHTYEANIAYRKLHHPLEYPNCGSVFKNITDGKQVESIRTIWPDIAPLIDKNWHGKVSMGYVINRLGFLEYRVNDAQISAKHTNFILNLGNAKAKDVLTIIRNIQEKTMETLGFTPEVEVEIIR